MTIIAIGAIGCGPTEININKKASYSDLVVTYNAEVQTLDSLEKKRKEIVAEFSNQAQMDALNAAVNSLGTGGKQNLPSNPNDALDRAVASAELQAQLQSGLLEKLAPSTASGSASSAASTEYPADLKRKLSELDAEIAKQKERVDRARKARDAAETK